MCHCGHLNLSHQVHSSSQEAQWNHCNITYTKSIAAQLNLLLSFKQPDWWAGNFMSVPFLLSANFQIPFFRFHWCYFLSLTDKRWSNKKKKKPTSKQQQFNVKPVPKKKSLCPAHLRIFIIFHVKSLHILWVFSGLEQYKNTFPLQKRFQFNDYEHDNNFFLHPYNTIIK